MASTIGIKIANGEFFPILEENSSVKKKLILTTVHDNQESVQIDLYNSFSKAMADALYVGSLVIEDIKPQPKGEPSIEMILASNAAGELSADAINLDSSAGTVCQHLSVSLSSIEEEAAEGEIPDFELEPPEHPPEGLYEKAAVLNDEEKKRKPWTRTKGPVLVIAAVFLLAVCGLAYFFFFNDTGIATRIGWGKTPAIPATTVPQIPAPAPQIPEPAVPAVIPAPTPEVPAATVPVISSSEQSDLRSTDPGVNPANRTRPPVASYTVPQTIPRGGAPYKIRWGDTLWDISEAFYRNPWLYQRIARDNNIRNPDRIISGTTIKIYPRN
jgi:hypothetical protein